MSFFVKPSHKLQNGRGKYKPLKTKYKKGAIPEKKMRMNLSAISDDDEVSSSDDEKTKKSTAGNISSSEDERETVQEKKLRLAKKYLKEIGDEQEGTDLAATTTHDNKIAKRLKVDYLENIGRLKISIAKKCVDTNLDQEIITLKSKECKRVITCLCLSPDNSEFFVGSKDGAIVKWCLETKRKLTSIPYSKIKKDDKVPFMGHSAAISGLAISGCGQFLCSSDIGNKCIQVWTNVAVSLTHLHTFRGHQRPITALTCHGADLYTGSMDRTIRVWRLAPDLAFLETVFGHQDAVTSLAVPIGMEGIVASAGGRDGTLRLWKLTEESQLIFGDYGVGSEAKASIDIIRFLTQDTIVSGGDSGDICIWSTRRKKPLCIERAAHGLDPCNGQPYWISSITTVANADLIASGSNNGSIKLWHLDNSHRNLQLMREIPAIGFVNSLELTKDGKMLLAAIGSEHKLGRWTVIKEAKNTIKIVPLYK